MEQNTGNRKGNLLLVQDKSTYFYPMEDDCIQPIQMHGINIWVRKACEILKRPIPKKFLNPQLFLGSKVIFTDTAFHIGTYKACVNHYGKDKCALYYMNTVNEKLLRYADYFEQSNIFTFDVDDAIKYHFKFLHTPYSSAISLPDCKIEYDVLFLGRDKGRGKEIREMYDTLRGIGLRVKFLVLDSDDPELKLEHFMDYREYLNLCAKSRSIVEINVDGQAGCSLRMLESLFLKKKLITNNIEIVKDCYFDRNNVFLWEVDSIQDIINFINAPYIEGKEVCALEFKRWIDDF